MSEVLEAIREPWPWYVAGPLIALIMFLLTYFDKTFGFSSNLRTLCTVAGAGRVSSFFRTDWRSQQWNLLFLLGAIVGGYLTSSFLTDTQEVAISRHVAHTLREELDFEQVGEQYLPPEIFSAEAMTSFEGILVLLLGGFLVGFGARYAGGCTSGHAITGLSHLQLPSLIAVIGFFIGGLIMTYFGLPLLFG